MGTNEADMKHELEKQKYPIPTPVYNADGTLNKSSSITEFVELQMQIRDHAEKLELAITDLERQTFSWD